MRAVVYEKPTEFRVARLPDPIAGPGEVRVRPIVTGVCSSDVHLHDGDFSPPYPLTPGHEIVGTVDQVGEGTAGLQLGQRVVVDNIIYCGSCPACRAGRTNFCASKKTVGVRCPGGFAELLVLAFQNVIPADDLDLEVAVLAEPTACAIHTIDLLDLDAGSHVLLFGLGPSGLILTQLLHSAGAAHVTVAAPTVAKLELALELGADEAVRIDRTDLTAGETRLRELAPHGFDAVIDATGAITVMERALGLTRSGGTLVLYGVTAPDAAWTVSPFEIFARELTIRGSFAHVGCFDRGLAALRSGRVRPDGIVTHRFTLEEYGEAIQMVRADSSCIKAVVDL